MAIDVQGTTGGPTARYEIREYPKGIAVFGAIPLDMFGTLTKTWAKRGFKLLFVPLAEALGATFVVVRSEADGKAWLKELGYGPENPDWLKSGDVGVSSKTIYATFTGQWHIFGRGMADGGAPHDADDFGRCHRLLKRYPEWVSRLSEVAEKCPAFAPLVPAWAELDALFVAGDFKAVSERIRWLRSV